MLVRFDAMRQPERLAPILAACEADARGRTGLEDTDYPQAQRIQRALDAARSVRHADVPGIEKLSGSAVGEALRAAQRAAVIAALK